MRRALAVLIVLGAFGAAPGVAAAASRYVDAETGADTNPSCPLANPCDTIAYAIANSGAGDEILLDSGTYLESVTVGDGRSLRFSDFVPADGAAEAIIDGGAGTAVTVPASGATKIQGLTIRGDVTGMQLDGPAEVAANVFDDPDATSATGLTTSSGASDSSVHGNAFYDPSPSSARARVGIYDPTATVSIANNTFQGLQLGVHVTGSGSVVEGNEITETHNLPFAGAGIVASGAVVDPVVLRENSIADSGAGVDGVRTGGGVSLERNEITGQSNGVTVTFNSTPVSMEGDRIWGNSNFGVSMLDIDPNPPQPDVTASNVTVIGVIFVGAGTLTLNSSIVSGIAVGGTPGTTCSITYSAGDTIGGDPTGCHDFDTTADPMLVDPANGDLHLAPGSPMIDSGDPADPGDATDFDGDPRALDGSPECAGNVARRDIGADEFAPGLPDCEAPDTTLTKTPPKKTRRKRVRFGFESTEPAGATFMCKLDGKPYEGCTSPTKRRVSVGRHIFRVFAIDASDNEDPTPDQYRFKRLRRH